LSAARSIDYWVRKSIIPVKNTSGRGLQAISSDLMQQD